MKLDKDIMSMFRTGKQLDTQLIRSQQDNGVLVAIVVVLALAIILLCQSCDEAHAEIAEDVAVRCLIGEAANQGLEGMVAVGEALRNRGTTSGVYGCKAKFVDSEPAWVWRKAKMAWERSLTSNIVGKATHWESVDFPKPYWAYKMKVVVQIGKHVFYEEIK